MLQSVGDDLGHRDERHVVLIGKHLELRAAGHGPVGVEDLADHPRRCQACQPRKIDRGLRLPHPLEHPSRLGPERKDMTRPDQIRRSALRIDRHPNGAGPIGRADPRRHSELGAGVNRNGEGRSVGILTPAIGHQRQVQPVCDLGSQREADETAAVGGHEIDDLRRHLIRRTYQIPFVLSVFVIGDDHEPAFLNDVDGLAYLSIFGGQHPRTSLAGFQLVPSSTYGFSS